MRKGTIEHFDTSKVKERERATIHLGDIPTIVGKYHERIRNEVVGEDLIHELTVAYQDFLFEAITEGALDIADERAEDAPARS